MNKISITKIGIQEGGEDSTYNTVGEPQYGYIDREPKLGERFMVWKYNKKTMFDAWHTSTVTEIVDDNNFNTVNSKYNWKYETD